MKRIVCLIIFVIAALVIFLFLGSFEIISISSTFIRTLWSNFKAISTIVYVLLPLLLLLTFCILFLTNRWAVRVEKASIGGFHIIFDNPAKAYKRQVMRYLDTKRTIFAIDFEYDNFYETFDSYFEVYMFFRDEIKLLGSVKKQGKKSFRNKESIRLYALTNQAIQKLNDFLTKNQSNYRRWYKYIEKTDEKVFYLTPIGELQRQYPQYEELCCGFGKVNSFFANTIACEFDIDIVKWSEDNPIIEDKVSR